MPENDPARSSRNKPIHFDGWAPQTERLGKTIIFE